MLTCLFAGLGLSDGARGFAQDLVGVAGCTIHTLDCSSDFEGVLAGKSTPLPGLGLDLAATFPGTSPVLVVASIPRATLKAVRRGGGRWRRVSLECHIDTSRNHGTHARAHSCTQARMHTRTHTSHHITSPRAHAGTHAHPLTHTPTHTHSTHTLARARAHAHACTHSHTHVPPRTRLCNRWSAAVLVGAGACVCVSVCVCVCVCGCGWVWVGVCKYVLDPGPII